ncbi:all trans-polyprenyl-diphosphate synthase PDSS1-like [Xenia sp. Carnegie-2017]|uniref:all trans-polyprenyl-diphosphate synthase PDSS1-like n=1 Tax=Xenia sp. Carnegie-2017 TaxID=2897299 RepID=UPI001F041FCB|nr:all trans-polyprenyl-diphosphate synthase PDSS1-like [Xenia sp. Carnegie-2017]
MYCKRKVLKAIALSGVQDVNRCQSLQHFLYLACPFPISALQQISRHKWNSGVINKEITKISNPHSLVKNELTEINTQIINELSTPLQPLKDITQYYFDNKGKLFRPTVILLMAQVSNTHLLQDLQKRCVSSCQKTVAQVAEMIHTASLVHDDIVDMAESRRGKASTHRVWGEKEAVLAGNYITSRATTALARLGNVEVIHLLAKVLDDLVRGEFMQMGSRENPDERFAHYLEKTFKKTASLLAHTCKAVALLANATKQLQDAAFQYGKNLGMAFQLVDDILDFDSTEEALGKPAAADLRLGLATGPVLFASEEFPEITAFIMRRFQCENDVEETYRLVRQSTGIERTKSLARQHSNEAKRQLSKFCPSPERDALVQMTENLLKRQR